jgi:hypothetical protein
MVVISWRSVRIEYSCVKQNVIRMYAELWITSFEKMENDVIVKWPQFLSCCYHFLLCAFTKLKYLRRQKRY